MPSTYSNLKIQLMATGENSTTWGNVTNVNLGTAIEEAITGSADIAFSNANVTLTLTDTNSTQTARNLRLNLTGTATAGYNLVVPAIEKAYIVNNGTDGTITVKNATGTGTAVPTGKTTWVFNNGTSVVDAVTHLTSLTLGAPLPVLQGGTGANTAAAARTSLSAAALGANTDLTSLSPTGSLTLNPTTGTLVGAPTGGVKGVGTINATGLFVNGVAVGVGSGSVSSVAMTVPAFLSITGSPITTSGTLAVTYSGTALPIANGGTGATSAGAARTALGAAASGANTDITSLSPTGSITLSPTTGTLIGTPTGGVKGAGTINATGLFINGVAVGTGSGSVSSVDASGGTTGFSFSGGPITTSGTLTLAGTLAIANGGTGATDAATARSNLGAGTVTSVGSAGTVNGITLTGTVTSSGSLTLGGTLSGVSLTTQVSGTLPVANGGTGGTTQATAQSALGVPSTTGTGASGSWGISVTGSAGGSAATLAIARTLTIGSTGKTFDGSANVAWSLTEIGAAASGANTDITALDQDVTITATGTIAADTLGFRGIPQNAQTASYTLALSDAGKHISITTGGIVIPANGSVAFPIGTTIVVYNDSTSSQNITITSDNLLLAAGTGVSGTRVLSGYGLATLVKVKSTTWVTSGAGLS